MEKEEAIEVVKKNYPHVNESGSQFETALRTLIPELKESEDDKIRKELIAMARCYTFEGGKEVRQRAISWLEKQGEQKPADKVEPKFKAGDTIIGTISNSPYYITEVCNGHYLTDVGCIIMFNAQDNFELVRQNPAWSEEDERLRNSCISHIEEELERIRNDKYGHSEIISDLKESCRERINWLKSIRPQNTWKPSDEQINALAKNVEYVNVGCTQPILKALLEDLKKLREE